MKKRFVILHTILISLIIYPAHAIEVGTGKSKIDIHGFASQGFMISNRNNIYEDTEDGTFQFNELGINFSMEPVDFLRIGFQVFTRDLGDFGNNDIELDWASADYQWRDWLGIRAGKIKIPTGLYNYIRDADMLRTGVVLPQSVYHDSTRDTLNALEGAGIYGYLNMDFAGGLVYEFQYGTMRVEPDSAAIRFLENSLSQSLNQSGLDITHVDIGSSYAGSLMWHTPLDGLRMGGSLLRLEGETEFSTPVGPLPYKMESMEFRFLSLEYTYEDLVFAAEYRTVASDTELTIVRVIDNAPVTMTIPAARTIEGYYGSLSYRFTDWFEAGICYSIYYPDKDDKKGEKFGQMASPLPDYKAWQKDLSLSTRFDVSENWTFKVEGHFINGTAQMLTQENPEGFDENSFLLAVKATFNF